jgi:surface antigen
VFNGFAARDRCLGFVRACRSGWARRLAGGCLAGALLGGGAAPAMASTVLQCVPYARALSGIAIHGDAASWWRQAAQRFDRGAQPRVGAVLTFKATSAMPHGHVAVVDAVLDDRHILLDHANWSAPGMIEQGVLAEDESAAGDWSSIRVWYAPLHGLGTRESPAFGFIYADRADDRAPVATVLAQGQGDEPVERAAG